MAESHAEPPQVRGDLSNDAARHLPLERFPAPLTALMEERKLGYRQRAYKTKLSPGYLNHRTKGTRSVPADAVIRTIAVARRVEPDLRGPRNRTCGPRISRAPDTHPSTLCVPQLAQRFVTGPSPRRAVFSLAAASTARSLGASVRLLASNRAEAPSLSASPTTHTVPSP